MRSTSDIGMKNRESSTRGGELGERFVKRGLIKVTSVKGREVIQELGIGVNIVQVRMPFIIRLIGNYRESGLLIWISCIIEKIMKVIIIIERQCRKHLTKIMKYMYTRSGEINARNEKKNRRKEEKMQEIIKRKEKKVKR